MERNKILIEMGQKIRALRELKGFSQENFAFEVGLHRVYYSRIERGEQNISIINLLKISAKLDVELEEIIPRKNEVISLIDEYNKNSVK
jgi:transcriptional regulator with XRE-family HTH domain